MLHVPAYSSNITSGSTEQEIDNRVCLMINLPLAGIQFLFCRMTQRVIVVEIKDAHQLLKTLI